MTGRSDGVQLSSCTMTAMPNDYLQPRRGVLASGWFWLGATASAVLWLGLAFIVL